MRVFQHFIVLLTLLVCVRLDDIDPTPAPVKAKATVTLGEPRLLSTEDVQMTCSVPDDPLPNWTYEWFQDGLHVSSSEVYIIKNARVQQTGNYTCQGQKEIDVWPYTVSSLKSDPLEIYVDGGWILLQTPLVPVVVDETMTLTCHVRDAPILSEVIFYKDDVQVMRQKDKHLVFPSVMLKDEGKYSCRASWLKKMEYQYAQSLPSSVTVLDKLDTPILQFAKGGRLVWSGSDVSFRCVTKVNAKAQELNLEYYYLKNGNRLGPASGKDTYVIYRVSTEDTGSYTCRVRVRALNVEKMSNQLQMRVRPAPV